MISRFTQLESIQKNIKKEQIFFKKIEVVVSIFKISELRKNPRMTRQNDKKDEEIFVEKKIEESKMKTKKKSIQIEKKKKAKKRMKKQKMMIN